MTQDAWGSSTLEDRRQTAARVAQAMQSGTAPAPRVPIDDVLREVRAVVPVAREQVRERTQEIRAAIVAGTVTPEMSQELRGLSVEARRLNSAPLQLASLKEAGVREIGLAPSLASGRDRLSEISTAAAATSAPQRIGPTADSERAALVSDAVRLVGPQPVQRFIEMQAAELGQRFGRDAAWMKDAGQQARVALDGAAKGAGLQLDASKFPASAFSNSALKSYADNPRAFEDVIAGALSTGRRMHLVDADARVAELSSQARHELLSQGVLREDRIKLGMGTHADRSELTAIQAELLQQSSLRHQIASLREQGRGSVVVHTRDNETPRDVLYAIQSAVRRADQELSQLRASNKVAASTVAQQQPASPARTASAMWAALAKAGAAGSKVPELENTAKRSIAR